MSRPNPLKQGEHERVHKEWAKLTDNGNHDDSVQKLSDAFWTLHAHLARCLPASESVALRIMLDGLWTAAEHELKKNITQRIGSVVPLARGS